MYLSLVNQLKYYKIDVIRLPQNNFQDKADSAAV